MVSRREVEARARAMVARGFAALDAGQGVPDRNEMGEPVERIFIGEYLLNAPVDHGDLDDAWYDALDTAAEKRGAVIESGEGDPNDIILVRPKASARRCACAPKPAKRTTKRRK